MSEAMEFRESITGISGGSGITEIIMEYMENVTTTGN
jgi:hypothetical protein